MKSFRTGIKSPLLSNALLVMKITTFLLLVGVLQVSARGFGQDKLNLRYKNAEIAGILVNIEKQSNYRFLYNNQLSAIRQKVTINLENVDIRQALDNLFSQTILTYRFMASGLIVINEDAARQAAERKITGKITDPNGAPLSGVTVTIKGTTKATTTNEQGVFALTADDNDVLVFSYVGFDTQEIKVGDKTQVNLSMASAASSLENIVVIGYGTVKKRDLTGAVVSLKGDEVKKVAAGNVMESVQGKVAGVDITRTSGGAGSNVNVTVRGNRSILAQNTPLFIVDGIQYANFQDINPNDIQSMEVLKDASSTAIYGSRGANGVIIITTKRGASGKVRVAANAYYGVNKETGYPVPMNGPQYAELKRQGARTAGTWKSPADDASLFKADFTAATDGTSTYWPGLLLKDGSQQDYGVNVASGSDKTKVFFSFDYFKEKGLLNNDFSGRYTLRLNIDQTVIGTFKVGLQSQLTYYDENRRTDNVLTVANKVIPYYVPYAADGSLIRLPGNANQVNPLLEEQPGAYINETNTTRILSSAYAEWKPFSSLTLRSNLGITNGSSRNGSFLGENTITRFNSTGSFAKITNATQADLIWENIITWNKKFGDHSLDLTAVTSYISSKQDSSYAQGTGQLIPGQSWNALLNNPLNLGIWSNYIGNNLVSGAFRVNYGYKGKYLLTLTGRADGSSVLLKENRWSFFPSAAVAWRIIDENFMQEQSIFSDLKLRASYGVAGNAAVKPYSTTTGLILIPYSFNDISMLAYGFDPQNGNRNLKWELTGTQNIGLDFGLFKNRITASVDYYDSKTRDLLLLRPLPGSSGHTRVVENVGKTRNNGIEVSLRTVNVQTKDLTWSSAISYTRNKERITDLLNGKNDVAGGLFIGSPVRSFYDFKKEGIWQTADSALARSFGYKPGDIRVADLSGDKGQPDGKLDATYDRTVVGSAVPNYTLGFSNDVSYKNFDLNVYVFARIGQTFVSDYANKFEPNAIENGANVNYWTPENPTNDYPRPNANISRAAMPFATTLGYKDGSFVKIRNITLGYTLPKTFTQKFHVSNLRWYVSAKNYFTFAKEKDYDPEGEGSFERPLTKLLVTGLNIEF
ncbi:SusC/RagA family protein [Niastella yeongjuensis]|uniref:SusC/RagA family protein n=1 Tax=Niastella yeongjuensis TaxID=354355 RepID=A0A1V9ENF2_9BACT|nr:TonB-dependent receptor [Niastella yeongjuensis]OQP47395.1 SusC/RagA family protein [Niastella yeongjuensis]SEN82093.1 TonB-linked outer membrane protein, SusC/RagA family [Niastella yeongjuensis]